MVSSLVSMLSTPLPLHTGHNDPSAKLMGPLPLYLDVEILDIGSIIQLLQIFTEDSDEEYSNLHGTVSAPLLPII